MGLEEADPIQEHGIWQGTKNKRGFPPLQMGYTRGLIFHCILWHGNLGRLAGSVSTAFMSQRIIGWVQSATGSEPTRACFQEDLLIASFIVCGTGLRTAVACIRSQWATYGPHRMSTDSKKHERMLLKHVQTAISRIINGMLLVLQVS